MEWLISVTSTMAEPSISLGVTWHRLPQREWPLAKPHLARTTFGHYFFLWGGGVVVGCVVWAGRVVGRSGGGHGGPVWVGGLFGVVCWSVCGGPHSSVLWCSWNSVMAQFGSRHK